MSEKMFVVRVGTKYINAKGLGTRRAAMRYPHEDAVTMGCQQTCGPFAPGQREAAFKKAVDEKRFQLEEVRQ